MIYFLALIDKNRFDSFEAFNYFAAIFDLSFAWLAQILKEKVVLKWEIFLF